MEEQRCSECIKPSLMDWDETKKAYVCPTCEHVVTEEEFLKRELEEMEAEGGGVVYDPSPENEKHLCPRH